MTFSDKQNKRKGIVGTVFFHIILIIVFIFVGLKYQDPPPDEEGIRIKFGDYNQGIKDIENQNSKNITKEKIIKNQTKNTEKIITQNIIETPSLEKTKEVKKEDEKKKIIEEKKEEIDKKALYKGKKKNKNSTKEEDDNGNQEMFDSNLNSKVNDGEGIGENGTDYQLGGRKVDFKAKPTYNIQVEGKVVVLITVDRLGNVTNAIPGIKGTTTLNKKLLKTAKDAALKTKFFPKKSAPNKQQGKIIYFFSLN